MQEEPKAGSTATVTAVLALLGGVHMLVLVIVGVCLNTSKVPASLRAELDATNTNQVIAAVLSLVLLTLGGVALLQRNELGRWLIVAGCVAHVAGWATCAYLMHEWVADARHLSVVIDPTYVAGVKLDGPMLIFPIITLVLAARQSTVSWLRRDPAIA